ncbi:Hypothetical protein NTJ_11149 [Nesidiocoris tenuis]|uniref:Uncharacterized protein n=1 Tax=Nesidiocoris tenuis TaxID=355587 RepID=A0ABN7B1N6_9HEMI|nr:Hypothetical protein NTJ_11149 [Nesidiocoris tenuis]
MVVRHPAGRYGQTAWNWIGLVCGRALLPSRKDLSHSRVAKKGIVYRRKAHRHSVNLFVEPNSKRVNGNGLHHKKRILSSFRLKL